MISATELMIGSVVGYKTVDGLYTVNAIADDRVFIKSKNGSVSTRINHLQLIPLTNELLEKLGFVLNVSYQVPQWEHKETGFFFHDGFCYKEPFLCSIRLIDMFGIDIASVHQLQSLYQSITGKPLDISGIIDS